MNAPSASSKSTDEEPSAKKQRLLSRSQKIDLSEDEVNLNSNLQDISASHSNQQPTTSRDPNSRRFSTVSVRSVSNVDLKAMVTNSLTLGPKSPTKSPQKKVAMNSESSMLASKPKPIKRISFAGVDIFYFERAQGFSTIPTHGDIALGMEEKHYLHKSLDLSEMIANGSKKKESSPRRTSPRSQIVGPSISEENPTDAASENGHMATIAESEEPSDSPRLPTTSENLPESNNGDIKEEETVKIETVEAKVADNDESRESDEDDDEVHGEHEEEEEVFHDVNLLQPLSNRYRKHLLKEAGVRINQNNKFEIREIRQTRVTCGCSCVDGNCLPEICECAKDEISCQVDRPSFPCSCTASSCRNPSGRMEFDYSKVRSHYTQTMKKLRAIESSNLESPILTPRNSLGESDRSPMTCVATPTLKAHLNPHFRWSPNTIFCSRSPKSPGTPNSDIFEDILANSRPLVEPEKYESLKEPRFSSCPSLLGPPPMTKTKFSIVLAKRSISFTSSMDRAD